MDNDLKICADIYGKKDVHKVIYVAFLKDRCFYIGSSDNYYGRIESHDTRIRI